MILNPDNSSAGSGKHGARFSPGDSANHFMVGVPAGAGGAIVIVGLQRKFEAHEALNLAAWIVALADPEAKEFHRVLAKILKT